MTNSVGVEMSEKGDLYIDSRIYDAAMAVLVKAADDDLQAMRRHRRYRPVVDLHVSILFRRLRRVDPQLASIRELADIELSVRGLLPRDTCCLAKLAPAGLRLLAGEMQRRREARNKGGQ